MWQPIETAPKDGSEIILLYKKGNATRWRGKKGYFATQGSWEWGQDLIPNKEPGTGSHWVKSNRHGSWVDYTNRLIQTVPSNSKNQVTHWMPLPELPKDV